jgi:hypothetical protein
MNSKKDAFLMTDEKLIPYLNFVKNNKRVLKLIHSKPQSFKSNAAYNKMYDTVFYPAISCFIPEGNERIYNLEFLTGGVS